MNREIKFRAKRIDNNKWAYGGLIQADDYCIIDQQNELYVEEDYHFRGDTHFFRLSGVMCDENTIGQFTGLHDADGKEIYEGDIILEDKDPTIMEIVFRDGIFFASIGNTHGENRFMNCALRVILDRRKTHIIGDVREDRSLLSGGDE